MNKIKKIILNFFIGLGQCCENLQYDRSRLRLKVNSGDTDHVILDVRIPKDRVDVVGNSAQWAVIVRSSIQYYMPYLMSYTNPYGEELEEKFADFYRNFDYLPIN